MGPHKNRNLGQRCAAGMQCQSLEEEMMLKGCTLGSEKVFRSYALMNGVLKNWWISRLLWKWLCLLYYTTLFYRFTSLWCPVTATEKYPRQKIPGNVEWFGNWVVIRGWENLKEQSRESLLSVRGTLRLEDRKMEECLKFHRHFLCDCWKALSLGLKGIIDQNCPFG